MAQSLQLIFMLKNVASSLDVFLFFYKKNFYKKMSLKNPKILRKY